MRSVCCMSISSNLWNHGGRTMICNSQLFFCPAELDRRRPIESISTAGRQANSRRFSLLVPCLLFLFLFLSGSLPPSPQEGSKQGSHQETGEQFDSCMRLLSILSHEMQKLSLSLLLTHSLEYPNNQLVVKEKLDQPLPPWDLDRILV